jgi:hypothetical protein
MNIASDGGDEASAAAETGETERTATIALITKTGKIDAGLQLNSATFRLNPFVQPASAVEKTRADRRR